ncbi:LamG-like jellyroll fold domain-containing protein [Lutibacter oceani]|uniref:LamG-like jellyroll fold domain-containing protein n=1 Tax=Lutibacter oceani TaxID=1853311 RepID=UPI000E3C15E5|nr:LamG-like jellyroll fold domain-containing protein [Lutibacter oceani]
MKKKYITVFIFCITLLVFSQYYGMFSSFVETQINKKILSKNNFKYAYLEKNEPLSVVELNSFFNDKPEYFVEASRSDTEIEEKSLIASASCKDISVYLDATGNASITAADIDNGSTGILSIDISSFTCADIPNNPILVTLTSDDGGTITTCQSYITIIDSLPPDTPTLTDVTDECTATATVPTTSDNCGAIITGTTLDPLTYSTQGTHVITWNFDDGNGNDIDVTQNVIVDDITKPTLTGITDSDENLDTSCSFTIPDYTSLTTAADNCTAVGSIIKTQLPVAGTVISGHNTTQLITVTADDGNGNTESTTFTITLKDITDPLTPVLSDVNVGECSGTPVSPTTTDTCGGTITGIPNISFPVTAQGTTVVTWTFADGNGNSTTADQNIILDDITKPTLTGITDSDENLDTSCSFTIPDYTSLTTAADNCTAVGSIIKTQSPVAGTVISGHNTTQLITVTADDGNGNTESTTFTITLKDITDPVITCPSNITTAKTSDDGLGNCTTIVSLGIPVVSDNCTTSTNIIFTAKVGGTIITPATHLFGIGNTTVVWTATDEAGNISTPCNQTVTVTDDEVPTISSAGDIITTTSADGTGNCDVSVVIADATFGDNCTGSSIVWDMLGDVTDNGIGQIGTYNFPIGTTTITYTVTDEAMLTATDVMTVVITDDEVPTITCLSDQNVNFGANCEFILLDYTSLAINSDNCSSPIITQSPAPGTSISGQTTVTLTATDSANNISTCTFEVIPTDNESPTAVCKDISVNLSSTGTVNISALDLDNGSTDNCGIVVRTVSPNSFNCGDVGEQIVTFTVVDNEGNSDSCTATVTVIDNTPPTMLCNNFVVVVNPITRVATINASDVDNGSYDTCGIATLTVSPSVFPEDINGNFYTTNTTLTAVDVNGNISTCTPTVTVEPPVNQFTYLTGEIIDPIPTYPQPASALIEATACPGGLYDPKDVEFTLEAIGTYNLQPSDVIHWEYSEDNGETWTEIPGTAGTLTYILEDIIKNTFVRLSITDADDPLIIQTSASAFVRFLPPDEPPIIVSYSPNPLDICLGETVTVVAESFFDQPEGQFGEGGKFNYAQPDGWRVDGLDGEFPASGNNTTAPTWKETNSVVNPNKTFSGINYDTSDNTKFAIAHSVVNNQVTTLETPVFSTVGMTASEAILSFHQGYYFCGDASGTIELSFDAGNTYGITLATYSNSTTGVSLLGDSCNKEFPMADPFEEVLINLGAYVGNAGLRIKFTFDSGADGGFCDDVSFPKDPSNGCNKTQLYDVGSGWAIDDVGFVFSQVDDELEWTDEGGTVIAIGSTATVIPVTPGIRRYGVTTLINGCRTGDDSGTNFIDIGTSLAYAGEDYLPVAGNCGEATLQLNAYDNTKKAIDNYNKGAWKNNLYVVPTDVSTDFEGTGVTGQWSIISSALTSSCGSSATFSSDTDPDAIFTGNPGTYTLRWTLTNGCFDEIDVKINDCKSLDFDGVNDFVTFKNNYNLNSTFSIETWVKPNNISGTRTIFSRKDASNNSNGYDLSIVNGQVRFNWYYSTGSSSVNSGSNLINTNRWYHLAVTYNGATYTLYVDGIELGTTNNNNPPGLTANNVEALLGAMDQVSSDPMNYYHGWIDELKIWNKALSVEHIRQMMNQEIDELGADVGGVQIPTKIYGPDNDNNGIEDTILLWSNLEAYYHMNINCGDLAPYKKGVNGRLRNITTGQEQTAPIPYTTRVNKPWDTNDTWTNFNVWDLPNSNGINNTPIDWNIVKVSHNITSDTRDLTLLGLLIDSGKKLIITNSGAQDETNSGHGLWITHYLKLNGFIDLVGESQLIQKKYGDYDVNDYFITNQFVESVIDDVSSGYIERDQQGLGNLYRYNDWSSPVGIIGQPQTTEYAVKDVLRDGFDSSNPKIITFIGGNNGVNSSPIQIAERWIYGNDNDNSWVSLKSTGTMLPAEGFSMKGTHPPIAAAYDKQNFVFVGKPHNGDIELPLTSGSWYLTGNPYPSALDAFQFIDDNVGIIDGTIEIWDDWEDNSHNYYEAHAGYALLTKGGGIPAANYNNTGENGGKTPGRYIAVAQGFGVTGAGPSGSKIKFSNTQRKFVREGSSASVFFKSTSAKQQNSANTNLDTRLKIRLGFKTETNFNRQILLTIDDNTTDALDYGYDAINNNVLPNDLYWVIDKNKVLIQAVKNLPIERVVPIGINANGNIPIKIKVDTIENPYPNMEIYLRDNLTLDTYDIMKGAFEITLEDGEYIDKYSMVFQAKPEIPIQIEEVFNEVIVFVNENNSIISVRKPVELQINKILLFNVMGQQIKIWESNLNENEIELPIKVSTGVYLVLISTNEGKIAKKIIIK